MHKSTIYSNDTKKKNTSWGISYCLVLLASPFAAVKGVQPPLKGIDCFFFEVEKVLRITSDERMKI